MCVASVAAVRASVSDPVRLAGSHFELFGLPLAFELDAAELSRRYREAAKLVHPDRFAAATAQEQRAAVGQAAALNDAYQVLKSPGKRALYLLNLQAPLEEEATVQDPEFLFQQMEWREELEELAESADFAAIEVFRQRLAGSRKKIDEQFAAVWQDPAQRSLAERLVRRMQFLDKVLYEVRQLEERLDDF